MRKLSKVQGKNPEGLGSRVAGYSHRVRNNQSNTEKNINSSLGIEVNTWEDSLSMKSNYLQTEHCPETI